MTEAAPSWIQPDAQPDSTIQKPSTFSSRNMVLWGLKGMTISFSILMFITAVLGIESIDGVENSGKIFVACYMLFFSSLLLIFEINEIKTSETIDGFYQRNFGFMYTVIGKALYLIFIAFLSLGLGEPQGLTLATATCLTLTGALEVGLYLKYPEMFETS